VTGVLGGNATGALNALIPVPVSGGVWRRSSLFPYSTVVGARSLIDSLDALSVFEAAVVDDCMRDWLGRSSSWRPRLAYGQSYYVHQLGHPLLITSTVAPESPFECWRSSGGCIFVVKFPWGRASDHAGVAPLEEFLTPSRVILPNS